MTTAGTKSLLHRAWFSLYFHLLLPFLILWPLYLLALALVVLPCVMYRLCNRLAAKIYRPDLDGIADVISQALISREARWSRNGCNIIIGVVVRGRLTADSVLKLFETQLLPREEYRRLKAYPVRFGGYFHWKPDLDFDVRNHVRAYDGGVVVDENVHVTNEDLKRVLRDGLGAPWRRNQSLWEVLVLNNYCFPANREEKEEREEKTVLVFRMQHVLGDGYSLTGLLEKLCTGDCSPSVSPGYKGRSWVRMMAELVAGPYFLCRYFKVSLRRDSGIDLRRDLREDASEYLLTWTEGISVKGVSEIKNKFGVCFQAVLNALVTGASCKLLQELGHEPPKELTIGQPWYVPGHPGGLSNHVAPAPVTLPLGESDAVRKLQICHQRLIASGKAASPELLLLHFKLLLFCCPYGELLKPPTSGKKVSFLITFTGCPGPRGRIFMDGKEVDGLIPAVGQFNSTGDMVITTSTSLGKMIFTTCVQKHFFSDPKVLEKFDDFLLEELQALLNAKPLETATLIDPQF